MKKSLIATITTAMFVLSLLAPVLLTQKAYAVAPDPTNWYMSVQGVLDTDYYSLYPYKAQQLTIGFSKFGEIINNNTNEGLEYNHDRDPWAAPGEAGLDLQKLPKKVWINGWMLDITYNHSSWGLRNLWAAALFGDLSDYGKPWLHVQAPQSCTYEYQEIFLKPGYEINDAGAVTGNVLMNGGRKTNASATTDPITVLYHGPRKFIATLQTHIWDIYEPTNATLNVVNVMFTIIFDKVSKEVIIYKEVKVVDQAKYQISPLRVTVGNNPQQLDVPFGILCQFSNREEWDLGTNLTTPKYASYVHFYTQGTAIGDSINEGLYTPYDRLYTVLPTLPANTTVIDQRGPLGTVNGTNAWGPEPYYERSSTYDVAQIISNDKKYVGFAAYWPSLSDWSADAGGGRRDLWYRAIGYGDVHDIDSFATPNDEPFLAPLTVGEWDFMLADDHKMVGPITCDIHFRAVAVYGLTDLNDGTDANFVGQYSNWIDREVMYQLQMVFAPWDIDSALDKKDNGRWVTKYDGDGEATHFYLKYSDLFPVKGDTPNWPNVLDTEFAWYNNFDGYYDLDQSMYDWTGYNYDEPNFGERVLVDGVLMERGVDYILSYDGSYYMYIDFAEPPALDAEIKILFSADAHDLNGGQWEWLVVGKDSNSIDSEGSGMVKSFFEWWWSGNPVQMTGSEMQNTAYGPLAPYILDPLRTALLPDRRGYRDAEISFNHGRLALKDDWSCHKDESGDWLYGIPIASSNIITVGGPSANIATEYTNDFTDALATLPGWTGAGLPQSKLFAVSCWSKNTYAPQYDEGEQTLGYGLISTFRDINGTVWFVVYGYTGQDTYYTSWALMHSDVLDLAFDLMPSGITTLILEFDYTLHPTDYCFVTIKEALGTISEFDAQACFLEHMMPPSAPEQTALQMWLPFPWWPETWVTDKFPTIHKDP